MRLSEALKQPTRRVLPQTLYFRFTDPEHGEGPAAKLYRRELCIFETASKPAEVEFCAVTADPKSRLGHCTEHKEPSED